MFMLIPNKGIYLYDETNVRWSDWQLRLILILRSRVRTLSLIKKREKKRALATYFLVTLIDYAHFFFDKKTMLMLQL